jgi:hypothetical protein
MAFIEGEYIVISTLPAPQGWQVGSISCFEVSNTFGFVPVLGFLIVRHDHGGGTFDVDIYPLTCEGVRTNALDRVLKEPNGTIWLDEHEFTTEAEYQGYVRKLNAELKKMEEEAAE